MSLSTTAGARPMNSCARASNSRVTRVSDCIWQDEIQRLRNEGVWNHALAAAWAVDVVDHAVPVILRTVDGSHALASRFPPVGFPLTLGTSAGDIPTREAPPTIVAHMRDWIDGRDGLGRRDAQLKTKSLDEMVGQVVLAEWRLSAGTSILHERLVACRKVTAAMLNMVRCNPGHRRSSTEMPALDSAQLTCSAVDGFRRTQKDVDDEPSELEWQLERLRSLAGDSDAWTVAADEIRWTYGKPDLWGWTASKGKYRLGLGRLSEADALLVWRARFRLASGHAHAP